MKTRFLLIGISIMLGLTSFPGFATWEEEDFLNNSPALSQKDSPAFKDVIIELDTPPLLDFKFPRIEGFKITLMLMRARLNSARINKNLLIRLNRFLDRAEASWHKPVHSKLRSNGFRGNLNLFKLSLKIWSWLRLIDRRDADFLIRKAEQALEEFEVESAVLEAKEILKENHQELQHELRDLAWKAGFSLSQEELKIRAEFFSVFNGISISVPEPLVEQIWELPNVKKVELDQEVQVQGEPWVPPNVDLVGAPAFWEQGITGKNLTIAILDSGIDLNHPDLKNNLWINQAEINLPTCLGVPLDYDMDGIITIPDLNAIYQAQLQDPSKFNTCVNDFDGDGEITGLDLVYRESSSICDGTAGTPSSVNPLINCQDEDGNQKPDDLVGWNFTGAKTNPDDDHYHGTHCAGIAAANGIYQGVAPEAFILPVKVLNRGGTGSTSGVIAGIDYVINTPYAPKAEVISMSIGSTQTGSPDSSLSRAADKAVDAGIIVVVAAANNGGSAFTISDPGSSRKAITVGASVTVSSSQGEYEYIAGFSSKGPLYPSFELKPDLLAPGANVCSARNKLARPDQLICNDLYHISLWGTSMATPHVAGAAVLIKQKYPDFTPEQVKSLLMQTALDLNLPPHWQGAGRLDLKQASHAQVLVSPQKIDFGIDPQTSSTWQSPVLTTTLTNLSSEPHTYQLLPAPLFPPGITYSIKPNTPISLEPGDSVQFQISLTIDNNLAPNADYPGYLHGQVNIIIDQNISSPQAHLDTFVIKTCLVTAGCEDCRSRLQIDIYDDNTLFHRFSTQKSIILPFQCNKPFNVFVTNWPPSYEEDTYFFVKDNNITNPNATILFKKSDAKYTYFINPVDINGANFSWNTVYMSLSGRLGLKKRFFPASSSFNPGLLFNATTSGPMYSRYLTMHFTELSDKYEFSWDLFAQKAGRYYQFNDYQGDGIFSNITYQNDPSEFRHPRIKFPAFNSGQSFNLAYGAYKYITIPANTITSDLLYFIPPKSIYNENIHLPKITLAGTPSFNSFQMPGLRANTFNSALSLYRSFTDEFRTYPLHYLKPSLVLLRDEIPLFQAPLIWYGVLAPFINSQKMYLVLSHKNYKYEKANRGTYAIVAPLFSLQTGEAEAVKLTVKITDSLGNIKNIEVDNLVTSNTINNLEGIPIGRTQLEINYPSYYFNGNPGIAQLRLTIDPHDNDLAPPFIDNFFLTDDDNLTDTFHSNTTNIINLKVSDALPPDKETSEPFVKLYYRIFGSNDVWRELSLSGTGQYLFNLQYNQPVYISLKIVAWDKGEYLQEVPQGNIMEYVVEPAFRYEPSSVCYELPPLPGAFYFTDTNGDGIVRIRPESDDLKALMAQRFKDNNFKCVNSFNQNRLILDSDGNGTIDGPDLIALYEMFAKMRGFDCGGNAHSLEINEIPELDTIYHKSGRLSVLVKSFYESPRPGFGVKYTIISDPSHCISLSGRNPHPDWSGVRDQYIKVSGEGASVFELSDENGISSVTVSVNPNCLEASAVEIEACVPADWEIIEYCNCSDPSSWFICYCQSQPPPGCDCNDFRTWQNCIVSETPPENCVFDSPYQTNYKQSQRVCAEPIILTIR